ncbi:unnamed protein product [Brachionus calyciflorus]|uniref:ABC transporter domain-containing protein n=1 Tax=Brachionus calyciflorus TaxID=104777 RepID=A0A813NQC5_9BILA|nr:unnamed protein product [Brachionus calyciflorus]
MLDQLKLLLWKNYTLRRRRKFRLFVEIFWPMFIFLITAWVRTRVPRSHQNQCHYSERVLPSGGIFPFITDFICETNNTCYNSPREISKSFEFRKFTEDSISYLNSKRIPTSISKLVDYITPFNQQRFLALNISKNLQLFEVLTINETNFKNELINGSHLNFFLNETLMVLVLNSIPNFNLLYSSYSSNYTEPMIPPESYEFFRKAQNLLNLLYGSQLERMDINRYRNRIDYSVWLRSKQCGDDPELYLLKSSNQNDLNSELCSLSGKDLETIFKLISKSINFTLVKEKEFRPKPKLIRNRRVNSIGDIFTQFSQLNFPRSICGDSKSSIFERLFNVIQTSKYANTSQKLDDILEYLDLDNVLKLNSESYEKMTYKDIKNLLEQANDLNRKNSDCFFIKKKYLNMLNDYEKTSSCFCKTIFKTVKVLPEEIQVLFKQIKPMLFGKILYAPNNSFYQNEIVRRANFTFQKIDNFAKVLGRISNITEEILHQLNFTSELNSNIFSLKMKIFFKEFLGSNSEINFTDLVEKIKYYKEILKFWQNFINCFEMQRFVGFETEDEAIKYAEELMEQDLFWAMVVFQNTSTQSNIPNLIDYKIRMNASKTHDTFEPKDRTYNFAPKDCPTCNPYILYGFIYVQDIIEKAIIEFKTNKTQDFGITTQMTPYPCYIADKFLIDISKSLPLFMVISWVYTVSTIVKDIVYEKEKKLKEFMQIMGLSNGTYWLSWFLSYFSVMFVVSVIICWIMKLGRITIYSDVSLLIMFFTCFNLATISQCVLISKFFNKASLASVVAGIAYFVLFLPYAVLLNYSDTILPWQQFLASLSSTVAFSYCAEIMASLELQTKGIKWSNLSLTPFTNSQFTLTTLCSILLFDTFLYLVLAWYIEGLFPGEYGVPKKWYFPFQKSYWFGLESLDDEPEKNKKSLSDKFVDFFSKKEKKSKDEIKFENFKPSSVQTEAIESNFIDETIGIEIKNLHKIYSRGKNHALKGLNINFYENEITAFLGHNGAGKSTTMHLLTGLYKPTYGEAKIYGLDIRTSMEQIRKSLGFVPQNNILFSKLTVYEHLIFYARLKGLSMNCALSETNKMLEETGLSNYADQYAKKLSGGMQRMLSIAIAFIGGSKTVILDEPTAGVDLGGRKSVWDILFKYKKARTLVITTHHLDEAEILSDRVAIISNGQLISHGSTYFLKKKFGNGYYLTLAKKSNFSEDSNSQKTLSLDFKKNRLSEKIENFDEIINETEIDEQEKISHELDDSQDKLINNFITSKIKEAILVENNCSEITYSIPYSTKSDNNYKNIFNEIEENMTRLGIENIGLSDTSLEEIFIKLVKQPVKDLDDKKKSNLSQDKLKLYSNYTNLRVLSKTRLIYQQILALFTKRYKRTKRNVKGFLAETVLPIIFVCLALFVSNFAPLIKDKPSLELHPWWFKDNNIFFISRNSSLKAEPLFFIENNSNFSMNPLSPKSSSTQINKIWKTFLISPGAGNRCVKNHQIRVNYSSKELSRHKTQAQLDCENFDFEILLDKLEQQNRKLLITELIKSNYSQSKISKECSCSSGFPSCSLSSGGDIDLKSYYKLKSSDLMYDLTGRNVTDWLIKTEFLQKFFEKRYGGMEFLDPNLETRNFLSNWKKFTKSSLKLINSLSRVLNNSSEDPSLKEYENFLSKNSLYPQKTVKIWYNPKAYHANVAYLNVLNNALLRSGLHNFTNLDEHGIIARNHPMKFSKNQILIQLDKRVLIDLFVAIFIIFALSFIPASFLVFLVEERENNSKQLQFVSGVKPYVYWLSNLFWDLFNYILPACICLIVFLIFDTKSYTSKENFPCLVLLIFLYGWSCIPLMYPINFMFKLAGSSFVISSSLNIFIGVSTTTSTTVLNTLTKESAELGRINEVLKTIFTIFFPHYCLGQGMLEMSHLHHMAQVKKNFGYKGEYTPFDFDKIGRNLLAMLLQGFFYFSIIILIEYNFFLRSKKRNSKNVEINVNEDKCEDEDVINEKNRVLKNLNSQDDYLKLVNLTKVYKKVLKSEKNVAVKNLSLGIRRGECFGLLGINGAGKSTTFKMITGEITPTNGDIVINGKSIFRQKEKAFENIGYCPQKNAIFPLLTAKEHLIFYARLRGIPEEYTNEVSEWALNRFGLTDFSDRIVQDYSGGNMRKLSTAIAILGNPQVICLDEPTSGMDARVRRILWADILSLVKEKRIVILTSHSMAECESLCTRLAIMVNGQFRCLGSPQNLKSKYGNGYRIVLKTNEKNEDLTSFVNENFSSPIIKNLNKDSIEFNLPFDGNKLSEIFGKLEENRNLIGIKDYSITQSSLDQIFINFSETYSKTIV